MAHKQTKKTLFIVHKNQQKTERPTIACHVKYK